MIELNGYHLPELGTPEVEILVLGDESSAVRLRRPALGSAELTAEIDALLAARERGLAERPVAEVIGVIDRVAARFLDPSDPLRVEAAAGIGATTGASREMTDLVLERMATDWRAEPLERLLRADLGDPRALDVFIDRPLGRTRSRAVGPALTLQIFSGTVPGVSITSLIRSLLVKSAVVAKTASGEPVLAPLFARGLAEEDEEIGSAVAVTYWAGGDLEMETIAMARADLVVAYGGTRSIESLRRRVPVGVRFLPYGHHLSFGVVAREPLSGETSAEVAADAAVAVATFDQQGCVSPHLFYVETGGETAPADWARLLAFEMSSVQQRLPRGRIAADAAARIVQARGAAEIAALAGTDVAMYASGTGTEWTVIYEADPTFTPSCLNRLVRVKPVDSLLDVPELVRPVAGLVQTVGVAGPEDRLRPLAAALARLGASRIAAIGEMPWPSMAWRHDGRPPIGDLVRWCDWD